ncbi:RNA-binding protein spenito-like isoform X2 [Paramacrobiotus metropolitanus]|uniref:RNA-binding protein spenito-like isoform X2 n=1 Tax=Paramacrobiotus metropolitanus TaxID=2943436 RepID=UPI002445A409|nr:RNA-binding protein spenito-like isoform X2 [Paramacrobiotus metropolitanus]
MNRRDGRGDSGMAGGGGIHMIPGGRGLGGGVWLAVQGLPRDWREMDIFRAMEKRYGKVNEVRRSNSNEREAMVQFVSDNDARFVWHLREMELYDRTVTIDLAQKGGRGGGGRDASPPPMRGGGGFRMGGGGGGGGMGMQGGSMRRQFSNDRPRDNWNEPRGNFVSNNSGGSSSFGNGQSGNGNAPVAPTPLPEDDEKATRTLFVGNLEYNVTESLLRSVFSKYGLVQDVDIKRPMQGNGVAYAFVRFLHLDFAYRAKCEMNGTRIGNYQCKIGYGKTNPTVRVWVGNLNYPGTATDLDENRLFDEFDRFGQIKKIDYVRGEHYGYITFASVSASQEACATMRGVTLKVNGDRGMKKIRLRVDYADPDDPYLPKMNKPESSKRRTDDSRNKDSEKGDRRRQPSRSKSGSPPPKSRDNAKTKRRRSSVEAESEPEDKSAQKRSRGLSSSPPPKQSSKTNDERKSRDDKKTGEKSKDSKRRIPVTETVAEFRNKTDVVWKGSVVLKSTVYPIASHLLRGPIGWLNEVLSQGAELQITRRLRLEEEKLKDVTDKMNASESATLMCFDAPQKGSLQSGQHTKPLKHLQAYLLEKEAAGVINANQAIIYIFPTCPFASRIISEDMPTLNLPENGAPVREEDLGILMIVSAPVDNNQPTGGAAE